MSEGCTYIEGTRHKPDRFRTLLRHGISLAFLFGALAVTSAQEGVTKLEGNPFRGRMLFVDKLCYRCHSVWGQGGSLGPEMARVVAGKPLGQLTGEFWNHTPRMISAMLDAGDRWPTLYRAEMADLLSYLYYLRLFDEPGSVIRGAAVFARLRCESCHSLGREGGTDGRPLDRFSRYTSPLPLAQAMWNAGPAMREAQARGGLPMPEFAGVEMSDIQAYIHERGSRTPEQRVELLPLPDPVAGGQVFVAKRCVVCHSTHRGGAPDLGRVSLRMTVSEISGILWNHSYAMQDQMIDAGIAFPVFQRNELADLISYLHLVGYRGAVGSPERGAKLFRQKGCGACHEDQRVESPKLAESEASIDAIFLGAAMWNHAPQMYRVMAEQDVPWPKFEEGDVEDLAAYLQRLARLE